MPHRAGRPPGLIPDGPKIRSRRVDLGLTANQVSDRIGFHAESIRRVERGGPMSDVFASRLAKALGVKVEDIARPQPRALASLDAKNGPVAANDRANERDTSRSTQ